MKVIWYGNQLAEELESMAMEAVQEAAEVAVEIAKKNAPVRTGAYRDSIHTTSAKKTARGNLTVGLEADVPYSLWIEIGTAKMPARWILTNAQKEVFPSIVRRVSGKWRAKWGASHPGWQG